jgi:phosphatidylglycerol lysyltransferase
MIESPQRSELSMDLKTEWMSPSLEDLLRARDLIARFGWNAMSYQILNRGIRLWFSEDRNAVIGYVEGYGFRVVAGAPVCDPVELPGVIGKFHEDTAASGKRVCYFGAHERIETIMKKSGPVSTLLLGSQPVWRPESWTTRVSAKASLRAQVSRARNKGVDVTVWDADLAEGNADLQRCLREWLATRGLPPMHFLVEPDTLDRIYDRRIFVAAKDGRNIGFIVASPVPLRNGWLIEQIIRGAEAPNGTAELMLDTAIRHLANSGSDYVTLGLSPLSARSGIPQVPLPAWINLLLRGVRVLGSRFYNFDGLDSFKAKFLPESWEPIYAISNEPHISLRTLYAIAGAFSGMSPVLFLLKASRREFFR